MLFSSFLVDDRWKVREASVLAVGSVAEILLRSPQGFDHHQFIANVLLPDLQATGNSSGMPMKPFAIIRGSLYHSFFLFSFLCF